MSACGRCARPTHAVLCDTCVAELVDALRALAHGTVDRRDRHARPSDHAARAGLYDDLVDTMARLDHTGPASAGRVRGVDTTVDYHQAAADLRAHIDTRVGTWARDVHHHNLHLHLPGSTPAAAAWLAALPGILAMHPAAAELYADITPLPGRIRDIVDRPLDRTYLGVCSTSTLDGECPQDLYADPDDGVVQCPRCRTVHETRLRRDRMLRALEAQLLTADVARTVLSRYMPGGAPAASTIRWWASIGRLTQRPAHPADRQRRPRYRLGDLLDLLARRDDTRAS